MKFISFIFLIMCCLGTKAQTVEAVSHSLELLLKEEGMGNASIGFYAIDTDTDSVIAEYNANMSLVPASTMKIVTTGTAMELLGTTKTFATSLNYTGVIGADGVLNGDVYIVGGGDPCLGSTRYKSHYGNFIAHWADELVKLGIDSINGRIVGDASVFGAQIIPDTWIWGDLGNYFGAGPVGLSIYENQYKVSLKSGNEGELTTVVSVRPHIPFLTFGNYVLSKDIKRDEAYIYGAPYQNNRIIRGAIPSNRSLFTIKGSIPDPAYLAAYELDKALKLKGVRTSNLPATVQMLGKKASSLELVSVVHSPQLSSIIKKTNMHSINLYAEHLLHQIALFTDSVSTTARGTESVVDFWSAKGMDINGFFMEDGSGLSRFNAITTSQLVYVLNYMEDSKNKLSFLESLPVSGKSGTLRSIAKGTFAVGKIRAKSGYMTRVRSYSGYVTTISNRNIAFAFIVNNYNCSAYQMKKKMERIMIKLAEIEE